MSTRTKHTVKAAAEKVLGSQLAAKQNMQAAADKVVSLTNSNM